MANNNSYIFNEAASGAINWVNTIFTVANPIESIESLRIGYLEYTDFIYSWNTITLTNAPSVINWGVFVDYFYAAPTDTFDVVNLIYDEVLSGTVDWVNRVFYSIYPIGQVDELRVGWVIYTSYTINGRAITLSAAPSIVLWAPHIDYYRSDVTVNSINSWITMANLRSSIYVRLWQTITSLQFPIALADEYITEWIIRVSKMKKDRVKRWVFSFHKAYDWTISSTDWNTISVWSTSKYLPSKWISIVDNWNVVYYNWKTSTTITSISWLELDTIWGQRIQYWYKLSPNVDKISEVFIDWFKLTPCDFAEYMSTNSNTNDKFMVYNGYLFLPYRTSDWDVITVVYVWKNTSTYDEADIIDFDWDYISVIKSFVLYNMYRDREDDRFENEMQNYKQVLKEYKRDLSKQYETTCTIMQTAGPLNRW